MKTYIQPQIVIEYLATRYSICQEISSPGGAVQGFGVPGGGGGPQ